MIRQILEGIEKDVVEVVVSSPEPEIGVDLFALLEIFAMEMCDRPSKDGCYNGRCRKERQAFHAWNAIKICARHLEGSWVFSPAGFRASFRLRDVGEGVPCMKSSSLQGRFVVICRRIRCRVR